MIRATSRAVVRVVEGTANITCGLYEGLEDIVDGGRDELDNTLQDQRADHVEAARERQKRMLGGKYNVKEQAYVTTSRRNR